MAEKMVLTVEETREMLGIARPTVYQLVHRKDFPVIRIGRRILVPKKQLEDWIDRQIMENGCLSF